MPCYHPLKRVVTGTYRKDGELKQRGMVVPMDYDTDDLPYQIIPCGKCIGCRLEYSRDWANRLMLEYKYHDPDNCWFVTYTYDDENVPINFFTDSEGRSRPSLTLDKDGFRRFNKALRKHYPDGLRFFAAGEYGETTFRPHVHCIYFGLSLDLEKLVRWSVTDQGFTLFKCPELEKFWCRGNVLVSSVSWETCAYVARYVTKKLSGDAAKAYEVFNIEPEFSLMSRRPGIGRWYLDDHPEIFDTGLHFSAGSRAINCNPPKYFRNILKSSDVLTDQEKSYIMSVKSSADSLDHILNVKEVNSEAERDYLGYLRSKEYQQKASAVLLKRSDV